MIHESAARGFARAAEEYERGRPVHSPAAVSRLVRELAIRPGTRVLDLAAGTGKLTLRLVEAGADVVAVEPVEEMRAALAASLPDVEALAGTAEAIPLADASVDVVTVGQAFHWFDGDAALAEIHRVLRPNGRLGLVWNARDESMPWVAALTAVMEPYRGDAPAYRTGSWRAAFERSDLFTELEEARFRLEHELDADGVVARVLSVSFIAALRADEQARIAARVRELLAGDPATRGRESVLVRYRTDVFWCERR